MVQLHSKTPDNSIPAGELKDGQIGVITQWDANTNFIGRIVQRYGYDLISIGLYYGECWRGYFNCDANPASRVRVLQIGELIEII